MRRRRRQRLAVTLLAIAAWMGFSPALCLCPLPGATAVDMGVFRLGYNRQGGPSGDDALESTNWNMAMAQRDVAGGRLTLMLMNSLEPATLPDGGSPHLFQTGESLRGRPLVDHQHPHDLFMNLSATWRLAVGERGAPRSPTNAGGTSMGERPTRSRRGSSCACRDDGRRRSRTASSRRPRLSPPATPTARPRRFTTGRPAMGR